MDDQRSRDAAERVGRWHVLHELESWLETPMLVLSAAWLGLVILEFTRGLSPGLQTVGWVIWGLFVVDFVLRLAIAPDRVAYLRRNALTLLSLVVPAFRVLRVLRAARILGAARAARGIRLVKVVGTLNRGMRALGRSFSRRGFGYVVALTSVVVLAGAAGILSFEQGVEGSPIRSYWDAVWWTAMMMTTMGTDYFPRTGEGRLLSLLFAVYAFAVFGYVTATIASFFIDRDAIDPESAIASQPSVEHLRTEIGELRGQLTELTALLQRSGNV